MPVKVSYTYCDWSDREEIRKQINSTKLEKQEVKPKEKENVK